ncbi:IclR family transcriptional regulator [Herbaspirillum sp. alder98]|uniref:IclR family transcriptional regulator n=1 Tax=Herbaspirillum sp. alder98 TaxID=2913096 RepID=UPI001CD8942E|nr:IclR family transcriptional regulator [Herbaspirillum sp. alder98]MCA1323221.1 IclR family transcriptional regulator [Herbaspirillum sp. alder98]
MNYTVDVVRKAVELLFLIGEEGGLGVTELARRSGNTKARAFRLLTTLEQCGLLKKHQDSASYSLGYRALILGSAANAQITLVQLAQRYLSEIGERCNESVLIRIPDRHESYCIAWWDAPHVVRVHAELGARRPLGVGASGKLLLAHATPDLREAILGGHFQQIPALAPTRRRQLEREMAAILERGYSVSFSEKRKDTVALSAPIHDVQGQVIAALSLTAPTNRVAPEDLARYIEPITESALMLSRALGYQDN